MTQIHFLHTVIDVKALQQLFESFNALSKVPVTLTDLNGNLLFKDDGDHLGAGWIKACTKYHRQCEQTKKNCIISDTYLAKHLKDGKDYAIYTCLNGLVDLAVPVFYNEEHIANLFSGQFFLQEPNLMFFEKQAVQYGFDVDDYLSSIKETQVFDKQKIDEIVKFLKAISVLISNKIYEHKEIDGYNNSKDLSRLSKGVIKRNEILLTTVLSLNDYIYSLDPNNCFEAYYTPFKVGLLEDSSQDLKGKHISELGVKDSIINDLNTTIGRVKSTKQAADFYFSLETNDEVKHYKTTIAYRKDGMGHFAGSTLHIRDISDERNAYQEIQKLLQIIDQSPVAIVITNKNNEIEYVNSCFTHYTGYRSNEVIGKDPKILKSNLTSESTYKELWNKIGRGHTWKGVFQNKRKDQSLFWEECIISPILMNGEITHFVAIKEDISARIDMEAKLLKYKQELETQLRKKEHDYKEIVEHLTGIVWEVDMNGIINFVSPNVYRYSDFQASELINQSMRLLFIPELQANLYEFMRTFSGNPVEFQDFEVFLDKGGKRTYLKASGRPVYDDNGNLVGIRGISMDYTAQREQNKQVLLAIWDAEERQRTRISMELHDSIGATMSALSMYMNTVNTKYPDDILLRKIDRIVKSTAQEIRLVARELKPPELESLGLKGSLNAIRILYADMKHLEIHLLTNRLTIQPNKEIVLALYRIIYELINNSVKHGLASDVVVNLFNYDEDIYLLYEDNGNGNFSIDEIDYTISSGIKNILTRVNTLGGYCQITPLSNCGIVVGLQFKY